MKTKRMMLVILMLVAVIAMSGCFGPEYGGKENSNFVEECKVTFIVSSENANWHFQCNESKVDPYGMYEMKNDDSFGIGTPLKLYWLLNGNEFTLLDYEIVRGISTTVV